MPSGKIVILTAVITEIAISVKMPKDQEIITEPTPESAAAHEEMTIIDHLEELRSRIIKALSAIVVFAIVCGYFSDFIINEIILGPARRTTPPMKLQNLVPYGQITLYFQVIIISSLVLSFPVLIYQLWKFVAPGLLPKEKQAVQSVVGFISLCFFVGLAFGYFVFLPFSLAFFGGFGTAAIENNIAVSDYISFFISSLLTTGIIFELPVISYILSKLGILTPPFMRHYRRHAIVAIFILAAIVTPSTDIFTQAIIAVPMVLLYEVSIWISAGVKRNKDREEVAAAKAK
jgi:sec-independent protein translocase protein TatC